MKRTLYHVTARENVESILTEGLRASARHGEIFAITNKRLKGELGLECSALFAIDPRGITGQVARGGHRYYRIIHQPLIEPKFLTLLWQKRAVCRDTRRRAWRDLERALNELSEFCAGNARKREKHR